MAFLDRISPVIRGLCDECGASRNIFIQELGGDLPCHHYPRGCRGRLKMAYTGPKAFIPKELLVRCRCAEREALAAGEVDADVGDSSAAASSGEMDVALLEVADCSVCIEELHPADAAMRCAGLGGKRHYFHAACLTDWIRQCQRSDANEASCPECRGPVQVQRRCLQEFLEDAHEGLNAEDREAIGSLSKAADSGDKGGWSDIRKDVWRAGLVAAIGIGVAAAVAIGVSAMQAQRRSSASEEEEGGRR
eukprot:NODE_1702_length_1079_cov_252.522461.p1 GENE.NODE_1702_length_1079_cov_252.522461~~NODE_1702_length_1079_cov_252.522461.p1  ORF type:complete len:249 (-),score=64.74 NODE_1702_length_1079_cov_252.522461:252-998(-)